MNDDFDFGPTPQSQSHSGARTPTQDFGPRLGAYNVLALMGGVFGVHNFYANRPLRASLQAVASLAFLSAVLYFHWFRPEMLAFPGFFWFPCLMLAWVAYDVATVRTDGTGKPLRGAGRPIRTATTADANTDNDLDFGSTAPPSQRHSGPSRVMYIVMALTVGGFGIHNFYAYRPVRACSQLGTTLLYLSLLLIEYAFEVQWLRPIDQMPKFVVVWTLYDVFTVNTDGDGKRMRT
jgi:TM2 domain-containing membrane protein YozV